jgi:Protein of unknown function (DUF3616)
MLLAPHATPQVSIEITEHAGMCDASASVAIAPTMFIVANDEDNMLRVYWRDKPGKPVHEFDLTSFLKVGPKQEADIEGATRMGDRVYWITSHGTNKDGESRPSRHQLFATEVKVAGDQVTITTVGEPYQDLLKGLTKISGIEDYKLGEAAKAPPEQIETSNQVAGLNIEGLSATPQRTLLLAFRNPVPGKNKKALIVPLKNPDQVVVGRAAEFGTPILLSLDGLGIRSIEYFETRGKYLIIAGPSSDAGDFKLYQWAGPPSEEVELIKGINFKGLYPEALIIYPEEKAKIQILSDDGTKEVDGKDCKKAKPEKRSFRSVWVTP